MSTNLLLNPVRPELVGPASAEAWSSASRPAKLSGQQANRWTSVRTTSWPRSSAYFSAASAVDQR